MNFDRFKTDEKRVKYLYDQVNNITPLNECRLYKEEQLQKLMMCCYCVIVLNGSLELIP